MPATQPPSTELRQFVFQHTPEQMAAMLFTSGMAEDDVLDLLKSIAEQTEWTPRLNLVGKLYLDMVHNSTEGTP